MAIKGIENLSNAQIDEELRKGAKFVVFQYCISVLVMSFKRSSDVHFVRAGESTLGKAALDEYGWRTPLLGVLVAFVTAVLAVRWLVTYLRTRSLAVFGWYRLAIAAVTLVLMLTNTI